MKYDFITLGGATRDVSFFTDQGVLIDNRRDILRQKLIGFEYGAKIKVDKFHYSFGGGAANAAVCLANFGLKTACLATVGKDEGGRLISKNLKTRGVSTKLLKVSPQEDSGSSFILIEPGGERIIFGARGANRDLDLTSADLKALKEARYLYLASLSGAWEKTLKSIFAAAKLNKQLIFWNPGAKQYAGGLKKISRFLKETHLLALNKDEAIELVLSSSPKKLTTAFLNNPENLVRTIKSFGPKIVVITLGADGVCAFDGQKIFKRPILREKTRVDTTGIGDIFNSTLAAGLVIYNDLEQAIKLALLNAAAKVSHLGAQNGLLTKEVLKKK